MKLSTLDTDEKSQAIVDSLVLIGRGKPNRNSKSIQNVQLRELSDLEFHTRRLLYNLHTA